MAAALVAALTASVVVAGAVAPARAAASETSSVQRIAGDDRVDTAARVAKIGWREADHVLLATALDYPDAVAAAALSAALDAPLLLTHPDRLSSANYQAMDQLGVDKVTILGGHGAVSAGVEARLREVGMAVGRVSGGNRFETAAAIARMTVRSGDRVPVVGLALGDRTDGRDAFPDALSAASLAGLDSPVPTLLTMDGQLPDATRKALRELDVERVLLLGGSSSISGTVVSELHTMGFTTERLEGHDRYATSVAVAQAALSGPDRDVGALDGHEVVVATGGDFADALGAGALAARRSAPLVLVPESQLTDEVDAFLRDDGTSFSAARVVGGPTAVAPFVTEEIHAALTGQPRPTPPPSCDPAYSSPDCAYTYRHSVQTWDRLAQCESGGNWAINTGNGYYGGIQFSLSSWRAVGGQGYPHQNSKWEQIHRGELLWERQGWGAWPSCSRKLGYR